MDVIELDNKVAKVDVSPAFDAYSKVIINIDNDTQVVAGNDSGRTLEFTNPFGSQSMADRVLASLQGFQYRPYSANSALLDPAAEIGDALSTDTSYGGIYTRSRNFGRLMKADVSAPHDEEIDHEYKFESPSERKFKRTVGEVKASILLTNNMIRSEVAARENADNAMNSRITQTANAITAEVQRATQAEGNLSASLSVQATEIAAKVSSRGGSNSSFGWALTDSSHAWYSGSKKVMEVTASGLMVSGTIEAKDGTIGGFTIGKKAIYNNISQFDGTQSSGVYLGTDGIQLGQNFKVSSRGAVTASSLALKGMITFLNSDGTSAGTLSAADLRKGAYQAANNYSSWNSAYSSTSPGGYCYGGAGGGYSFTSAINAESFSSGLNCKYLTARKGASIYGTLYANGGLFFGGHSARWGQVTIDGNVYNILTY